MTFFRIVAVLAVFAVANPASAQFSDYRPMPVPVVQSPQFNYQYTPPVGTGFFVENAELLGKIWLVLAVTATLALIGGIALKLWANTKQTNDPLKLAMADPWMRAKIQAMSEAERAQFLAHLGR